ncbi:uncharacterized protein HD556DRAFT_1438233 [Suillus plorans]|uniref:Uncharacterized protein n=1 Tax=Suillus plorans TaxID=116603 RepID=A0A9P7J4K6_9AGAM|nr:uncharacterized protein HD556DRAFT_1438233 [Suillus plorans]KAG1802184.1 hypothetical protein HD556DRAFT_1438233 [Suillus plorans]
MSMHDSRIMQDTVLLELPWYTELDAIWHSNPSMAAKVHSSRPGVDHTGAFYSLIQPHGGAGPSMYYGNSRRSSHTPNVSDHLSAYQCGHHVPQNFAGGMYPPATHDSLMLRHSAPPPPLPSHLPSHVYIADNYSPLHSPLGNALDHVEGDDDIMMLNDGPGSPCPVAGKKQQLPSSPSPSASPSSCLPCSRTVHRAVKNSGIYVQSDMSQQVEQVKDEIESFQLSVMSCHEGKHQHYIAKLEAKSEHNHDMKKCEWLRATREHEASQAAVSHQRQQEVKDTEIRLCEMDIRVHQAHSLVLDKEAETLRLKIQFHQMMQASKASLDAGTG